MLTLQFLRDKFTEYNNLIFNGQLPMPLLRINRSKTMLGNVRYKRHRKLFGGVEYTDFSINISCYYDLEQSVLEDTIIHEMIHYYILYNRQKDTSAHGVIFQRMMNDINQRFGRHITISCREQINANNAERKKKQYVVAVSELPDGSLGVTIPCAGKAQLMAKALPFYFKISSLRWYNSRDVIFDRIPKSRTPKIYKLDQEKLRKALEEAIPLVNFPPKN